MMKEVLAISVFLSALIATQEAHRLPNGIGNHHRNDGQNIAIKDEYIVSLQRYASYILDGLDVRHVLHRPNKIIALIRAAPSEVKLLSMDKNIDYIHPNYRRSLPKSVHKPQLKVVGDTQSREVVDLAGSGEIEACEEQFGSANTIWGLIRTSYRSLPEYDENPYVYSSFGADTTVYVLDTGVDILHPQFAPSGRARFGMVSSELESEGPEDQNGHGTNVASIAAGVTYGVAKEASIVSCKVLDSEGTGTTYSMIEGINWVSDQVRQQQQDGKAVRAVINLSVVGEGNANGEKEAIEEAASLGIPIIVAAGNDGKNANSDAAQYEETMTVGAIGRNDEYASFSNWGPAVDISAAGVSVLGADSTHTTHCQGIQPADCVIYMSGTDQAAPYVSGVTSLWLESLPDATLPVSPDNVRAMLQGTASMGYIQFSGNQHNTFDGILFSDIGNCTGKGY